jgi:hypothetical protein
MVCSLCNTQTPLAGMRRAAVPRGEGMLSSAWCRLWPPGETDLRGQRALVATVGWHIVEEWVLLRAGRMAQVRVAGNGAQCVTHHRA